MVISDWEAFYDTFSVEATDNGGNSLPAPRVSPGYVP